MRRSLLGLVAVLGFCSAASDARAQTPATNINDPFFQYYAFYLPRSQALANTTGPEATINAISAQRQAYATTNRNDMFDNSLSDGLFDSDGTFVRSRSKTGNGTRAARHAGNLNGLGPQGYFGGSPTLKTAYPTLRPGRGRNANMAVQARGRSGGYGGGFGGGGVGLPGPR